jgi:hypothetical protein
MERGVFWFFARKTVESKNIRLDESKQGFSCKFVDWIAFYLVAAAATASEVGRSSTTRAPVGSIFMA